MISAVRRAQPVSNFSAGSVRNTGKFSVLEEVWDYQGLSKLSSSKVRHHAGHFCSEFSFSKVGPEAFLVVCVGRLFNCAVSPELSSDGTFIPWNSKLLRISLCKACVGGHCRRVHTLNKVLQALSENLMIRIAGVFLNFTVHTPGSDYSTVGCRRTGGRRSQPGSFLFFTTPANIVLIFQSDFESRRLACSAHTTQQRMPGGESMRLKYFKMSTWSRFEVSNAVEEVVFTAKAVNRS